MVFWYYVAINELLLSGSINEKCKYSYLEGPALFNKRDEVNISAVSHLSCLRRYKHINAFIYFLSLLQGR